MWRICLIIFSILVLSSSVFAHDLMFNLEHKHPASYYIERDRQEFNRAKLNYTTTGDPKYMIPFLGWPKIDKNYRGYRDLRTRSIGSGSRYNGK